MMIFLPDAVNRTILSLFFWTKHRNVTNDERTDRTAVCIASNSDTL